jgi:hypothetical protein
MQPATGGGARSRSARPSQPVSKRAQRNTVACTAKAPSAVAVPGTPVGTPTEPLPQACRTAGLPTCGAARHPAVHQGVHLPRRSAADRWMPSVRTPDVPQLRVGRPDFPAAMPPHPCVRVAVDERELIPRPHPQGHQVKPRSRTLWRQPVPSRKRPRWGFPSTRRQHHSRLGGNRPAPPGFACRQRPSAGRCERRHPARTTRPSHVPMMPLTVRIKMRPREAGRSGAALS